MQPWLWKRQTLRHYMAHTCPHPGFIFFLPILLQLRLYVGGQTSSILAYLGLGPPLPLLTGIAGLGQALTPYQQSATVALRLIDWWRCCVCLQRACMFAHIWSRVELSQRLSEVSLRGILGFRLILRTCLTFGLACSL